MKLPYACLIGTFIFAGIIWADPSARPDLNGVWRLEASQSEIHSRVPSELTWQIEQTDNGIHLIQREGDKNASEWRCNTDGKDCKAKDEGRTVVLSFYYNGPVLVELESEGANRDSITKKRISLSKDGNLITVEVVHLVPQGRPPEKLVLSKQPTTTAQNH
jgi:hypothetical protein